MGFDVIYMPPIHPIGAQHRKGPNNTLLAGPHDPGSPWAIGAKEGGHDAIHPDLGTFEDFDAFVARAGELGLEVALDLALQAAPDHPWVAEPPGMVHHPRGRQHRLRGEPAEEVPGHLPAQLRQRPRRACPTRSCGSCCSGSSHGVQDLPRGQPAHQAGVVLGMADRQGQQEAPRRRLPRRGVHPPGHDARARPGRLPAVLHLLHLAEHQGGAGGVLPGGQPRVAAYFRPNFFVNTPDILTEYLQFGGPAAFKIRAALAATASPIWGVYAGYELYEHVARPGAEEYIDNEKFEYKARDWDAAAESGRTPGAVPDPAQRDPARAPGARGPAEPDGAPQHRRRHGGLSKHKTLPDGTKDTLIIVVNVDPHGTRESTVSLDLAAPGAGPGRPDAQRRLHRGGPVDRRKLGMGRVQLRPPGRPRRTRPHPEHPEVAPVSFSPQQPQPALQPRRGPSN